MKTKDAFMSLREQEQSETTGTQTGVSFSPKKLLNVDRKTIISTAMSVVNAIQDGEFDLVDTFIEIKKGVLFFETLEENTKAIVYGKSLVGKGEVLKRHSVEIEQSELGVKWDYSGCNDVILDRLTIAFTEAKKAMEDRQNYLKIITTITEQVDMETGETYKVNPPVRTSTNGYKFSVK